jgi:tetratricopeptide (TPR) repeat protein
MINVSRNSLSVLAGSLLFLLVLGAFWPAVHNDFVGYDDPDYVTGNWHIQKGWNWETIKWAFVSGEAANWHPLTWLSHALDWEIFGPAAWGHHLTNILLHAINTLLCFLALKRLTNGFWESFVVALLFGLHPLRVESVAWVAERKDVLSGFFFFLTLLAYASYVKQLGGRRAQAVSTQNPGKESHLCCVQTYALAFVLFVLGLLSKPMLVTLPFVLLLLDYWPLSRFEPKSRSWKSTALFPLLKEKVPFFAAALAAGVITLSVQHRGGAMATAGPLVPRVENAVISYCRYLGKIFLPVDLAVFYPPVDRWPILAVLLATALLVALTVGAVMLWASHPYVVVGWFWFVGMLLPVIGLIQVGEQSMADRYTYLPAIGFLLMVVWGICAMMAQSRLYAFVAVTTSAAVALGCLIVTREQIGWWRDSEHLFRHALSVTTANHVAHNNLGTTLDQQGKPDEAAIEFQEAIAARPGYAEAHKNLGSILERQGRFDAALGEYQEALRLKPRFADACNGLGSILSKQGKAEEAMRYYSMALSFKPDNGDAHFNLGIELERAGRFDEAIREFETTLGLQPRSADVHNSLGVLLERKGDLDAAIQHYLEALRLKPDYPRAHFNLGVALSRKGLVDDAIAEYREVLKLKPDHGAARTNLSLLLELKNSMPRAVEKPLH